MKKVFILLSMILSILILCSCESKTSNQLTEDTLNNDSYEEINSFVPDYREGYANKIGNTSFNLMGNDGMMARQDEWIYYSHGNGKRHFGQLYKMPIGGTSNHVVKLLDEEGFQINSINVIEDWIYYYEMGSKSIYKIKTDGTDNTMIIDEADYMGICLIVVENQLYYTMVYNTDASTVKKKIISYNIDDGTKTEILADAVIEGMFDDSIIFSYYSQDKDGPEGAGIYNLSTGMVEAYERLGEIRIREDYLTGNLYKLNTDVVGRSFVGPENKRYIYTYKNDWEKLEETEDVDEFNFGNGNIYYSVISEYSDKGLYSIKSDGTDKRKVNNDKANRIFIVDDEYIYYQESDKYNWYRCRMDGTGWEDIEWMYQ